MSGIVGLNMCCVKSVADGLGVPWDDYTIDMLGRMESERVSHLNRKAESERQQSQGKKK